MNHLLVYPMAFYVFYIGGLLLFTFFGRLLAVKSGKVSAKAFKVYSPNIEVPDYLVVRGRHYDNQFQAPMLFMVTCLTFISLNLVNMLVVYMAWLYVATRLVHSWVHLGRNYIPYRFKIFGLSWLVLLGMWGVLVFLLLI